MTVEELKSIIASGQSDGYLKAIMVQQLTGCVQGNHKPMSCCKVCKYENDCNMEVK